MASLAAGLPGECLAVCSTVWEGVTPSVFFSCQLCTPFPGRKGHFCGLWIRRVRFPYRLLSWAWISSLISSSALALCCRNYSRMVTSPTPLLSGYHLGVHSEKCPLHSLCGWWCCTTQNINVLRLKSGFLVSFYLYFLYLFGLLGRSSVGALNTLAAETFCSVTAPQ